MAETTGPSTPTGATTTGATTARAAAAGQGGSPIGIGPGGFRLAGRAIYSLVLGALLLVLAAAVANAAILWNVKRAALVSGDEFARFQQTVAARLEALDDRVQKIEQAQTPASAGSASGGGLAPSEAQALRDSLEALKKETAGKMADLESNLKTALGDRTALSVDLRLKSLMTKAQGEVLKAKVDLAEANRGKARSELTLAEGTLKEAARVTEGPDAEKIAGLLTLLREARADLITESATGPDNLELLWHRISSIIGSEPATGVAR